MKKIHIAASCNTNFVPHLAALLVSILDNCSAEDCAFRFYVVDDDIAPESKELLRSTVSKYPACHTLTFFKIDPHEFDHVVISERIPQTAYYRIKIPELFRGEDVDKILYLDCDMIALQDIDELWETELGDQMLAAVEDAGFHQRLEKMGIQAKSNRYFNSGLMLINVKQWLAEGITEQVFEYIQQNPEKLRFHDQDALNAILHDRWVPLHPKWNAQKYILAHETVHPNRKGKKEYAETRQQPYIIHYTGRHKPWDKRQNVPAGKLYQKYSHMTDF